jgi:hypothetical protein
MMEHRDDAFDGYEPARKPKLILPVALWAGFLLAVVLGLAALPGCAQEPQKISTFQGLCALQPAGRTDSGVAVFHTYCEALE